MIDPLKLLLFITLSALAVIASLHAWRTKQSYGFFRFVGFESLSVLIVVNTDYWFREPFSVHQLISWTIFVISTAVAAYGSYLLKTVGKAQNRVIEGTQTVVETGVYRYIRHPLYGALAFIGWGVFFKNIGLINGSLAFVATIFWFVTARYEEHFNIVQLGEAYSGYMKRTKMFIPYLL